MGLYFAFLGTLILMAAFIGYEILAGVRLHDLPAASEPVRLDAAVAAPETSACFQIPYSPNIRECGGLLPFSPSAAAAYAAAEPGQTLKPKPPHRGHRKHR
jgi:hypothetical protein